MRQHTVCTEASRRALGDNVGLALLLAATCLVSACTSSRRQFEIRARDPLDRAEAHLRDAYSEEFGYIRARRDQAQALAPTDSLVPPRLIGLALSGGGIRAASFSLGALQAFDESRVLDQVDYMSAVSGGGYLAGWLQAHFGAKQRLLDDEYAYEVGTTSAHSLLDNHGDHVEHLRTHTGFLVQGRLTEGLELAWDWLWRWPFHLLLDDVIHLRGWWNFHHVVDIYRGRIEDTYFRGTPPRRVSLNSINDTRLTDINDVRLVDPPQTVMAPYLILNGNLVNGGSSLIWNDERCLRARATQKTLSAADCKELGRCNPRPDPCVRERWPFEFTRDFVGSDATGYLDARGFAAPVKHVERDADQRPTRAEVELSGQEVSPFRLSEAVAASGAAFDSAGAAQFISTPGASEGLQLVGGALLNLHLGIDVPNFARHQAGPFDDVAAYAAMFTYQRLPSLTNASAYWLDITDGGHYENLGVLALLRRGTQCIVSLDAGEDSAHTYADLKILRQRVEEDLQLRWPTALPPDGQDPEGHYRFVIEDPSTHKPVAIILYLKSNAAPHLPHLQAWGAAQREPFLDVRLRSIESEHRSIVPYLISSFPRGEKRDYLTAVGDDVLDAVGKYYAWLRADAAQQAHDYDKKQLDEREAKEKLWTARATIALATPSPTPDDSAGSDATPSPTPTEATASVQSVAAAWAMQLRNGVSSGCPPDAAPPAAKAAADARQHLENAFDYFYHELYTASAIPPDFQLRAERRQQLLRLQARKVVDDYVKWDEYTHRRNDGIAAINAFGSSSSAGDFPHDSTLQQQYSWERFEAYRFLGYQLAGNITDRFPLAPTGSGDPNHDLDWCRFSDPVDVGTNP